MASCTLQFLGSVVVVFLVFAMINLVTSHRKSSVTIPHNVPIGHVIGQIRLFGQHCRLRSSYHPMPMMPQTHTDDMFEEALSDLFALTLSGKIVTTDSVSSLANQTIHLTVHHVLNDFEWHDYLKVSIKNVPSLTLSFQKNHYTGIVAEDVPVGTIVDLKDQVHAFLIPENGQWKSAPVHYRVQNSDCFAIEENPLVVSPNIMTTCQFNRDNISVYHINIEAVSGDLSAHADAVIFIEEPTLLRFKPLNDLTVETFHGRRSKRATATHSVDETRDSNIILFSLRTGSLDTVSRRYVLTQQSVSPALFEVNELSGNVSLIDGQILDYDADPAKRQIILTVDIIDTDTSETEQSTVTVNVQNVNDERPKFVNSPHPFYAKVERNQRSNYVVYELMGEDPDGSLSRLDYHLHIANTSTGARSRFVLNRSDGTIQTAANIQPFPENAEYVLYVSVRDMGLNNVNGDPLQQSDVERVRIRVGDQPPQFMKERFEVDLREDVAVIHRVTQIKAMSFQNRTLTYELVQDPGNPQNMFEMTPTGDLNLLMSLDYDIDAAPKQFQYDVKAIESNGLTTLESTTQVIINLVDVNDNPPMFDFSMYRNGDKRRIPEDATIGTFVIDVGASDKDSGINGELEFTVDDDHFRITTIDNRGRITVNRPLDYDNTTEAPSHLYQFAVYVQDKGATSHTATAQVMVDILNINDEPPTFEAVMHREIPEDSEPQMFVYRVQVSDKDGDGVRVYFSDENLDSGPFRIAPQTGAVTLVRYLEKDKWIYNLNLTARDDGSCCEGSRSLRSQGVLVIEVLDVNDNRPNITNCDLLKRNSPTITENLVPDTYVTQIIATDVDIGRNGNVTYELINSNIHFSIHTYNGTIWSTTSFDRETRSTYSVTVKAKDQGEQARDAVCDFQVVIGDANDSPPVFNPSAYTPIMSSSLQVQRSIDRVSAFDDDVGDNSLLVYYFVDDFDGSFSINNVSGIIYLQKAISSDISEINLVVGATDHGTPRKNATAQVTVTVQTSSFPPPRFFDLPRDNTFKIAEDTDPDVVIATLHAELDEQAIPRMRFSMIVNDNAVTTNGFFSIVNRPDEKSVELIVGTGLDYETDKAPSFVLQAVDIRGYAAPTRVTITVILTDVNDEKPQFISGTSIFAGHVIEHSLPNSQEPVVTGIEVRDDDFSAEFRQLRFSLENKSYKWTGGRSIRVQDAFHIDAATGDIYADQEFDLDDQQIHNYILLFDVIVSDSVHSANSRVRVDIWDTNDHDPTFEGNYTNIAVLEDKPIGFQVVQIHSNDVDTTTALDHRYNLRNAQDFRIDQHSGWIMINNKLDYEDENRRLYILMVEVIDGINERQGGFRTASMELKIQVLDANDNPPSFPQIDYTVENVTEEDTNVPFDMIQVHAVDADVDQNIELVYSLNLPVYATNAFKIHPRTGVISVHEKLDRDTYQAYEFIVIASDTKLIGIAAITVRPIDINDNKPIFDQATMTTGSVREHSVRNDIVKQVTATDLDIDDNAVMTYSITRQTTVNGIEPFEIDSVSGLITVSTNDNTILDRELPDRNTFSLIILATDHGVPPQSGSTTMVITLTDTNDQVPTFDKDSYYNVTLPEATPVGTAVLRMPVSDSDLGRNAFLTFTMEESALAYFEIDNDENNYEGVIRVFKPPDYEERTQRLFDFTVTVEDPEPSHTATKRVVIRVLDSNDEAPSIDPSNKLITVPENNQVGTILQNFSAKDNDEGINAQFEWSINETMDPEYMFEIDGGSLTLVRELDYETKTEHVVFILAIDKGSPPMTGTATLTIKVLDVNDNAPIFLKDYNIQFPENVNPPVTEPKIGSDPVRAQDLDGPTNQGPFNFKMLCSVSAICDSFTMNFVAEVGITGGAARFNSKQRFDREKEKTYRLPIVMIDSGNPQKTGTNTLTVTIADENDEPMEAGMKTVHAYWYEEFDVSFPIPLGRVYVKDKDDWDLPDKTFTAQGSVPYDITIDAESGEISLPRMTKEMVGTTEFNVEVFDSVFQNAVTSTVRLVITKLPREAVYSHGSVTLKDITDREFVDKPPNQESKYEKFRSFVAESLQTDVSNVDIFSVMEQPDRHLNVFYSAHGSPYYEPIKLDALMEQRRDQFTNTVGVQIAMLPITTCLDERQCITGGCWNRYVVDSRPRVIDANSTSLVALSTSYQRTCTCEKDELKFEESPTCGPEVYCYNGGTCLINDWEEKVCTCLAGYDGPRCQKLSLTFTRESYALLPALAQCMDSRTTLEIYTTAENGLLFYNGAFNMDGEKDFIALELKNGFPILYIDHGTGTITLTVQKKLNDNEWHHIAIVRRSKDVTLTIDHCEKAPITESNEKSTQDRSACEVTDSTPRRYKMLNLNTPLQVGGLLKSVPFPTGVSLTAGYTGCMKNFRHNGQLYDLGGGVQHNTKAGCSAEESSCGHGNNQNPVCGENGICIVVNGQAECSCKPGFTGNKCKKATNPVDFQLNSRIEWKLSSPFAQTLSQTISDIQLRFRSRQEGGMIFYVTNRNRKEYIYVKLSNGFVRIEYDLGRGTPSELELSAIRADNGAWHTVYVKRYGKEISLSMDGREGKYYVYSSGPLHGYHNLDIDPNFLVSGALMDGDDLRDDFHQSCIDDVRYEGKLFPLQLNEDTGVALVQLWQNMVDGCERDDCAGVLCTREHEVCVPLWEAYVCRCKPGYRLENNTKCVLVPLCTEEPCLNISESTLGLGTSGLITILVCLFAVMLLILAVFVYITVRRRRKEPNILDEMDPYDDIRENIVNYDDEGAGEEDQDAYDLSRLSKPIDGDSIRIAPLYNNAPHTKDRPVRSGIPAEVPDVGNFIEDRMKDADDDPNGPRGDSVREYGFEGEGSDAGSLSSLNTSTSSGDQDYDYLNDWGPKFAKLADMYGGGYGDEED